MITRDPIQGEHAVVGSGDEGDVTPTLTDVGLPAERPSRRIKLFLQPDEIPWLPVSEPAFLLWVLIALVLIWVGIAVGLRVS